MKILAFSIIAFFLVCLCSFILGDEFSGTDAGNPSWSYRFDRKSAVLEIAVDTNALAADEQLTDAACDFDIDGRTRTFVLQTPIAAGTMTTQTFGLPNAQQARGIEMNWTVAPKGEIVGQTVGETRSGRTPPSNVNGGSERNRAESMVR